MCLPAVPKDIWAHVSEKMYLFFWIWNNVDLHVLEIYSGFKARSRINSALNSTYFLVTGREMSGLVPLGHEITKTV